MLQRVKEARRRPDKTASRSGRLHIYPFGREGSGSGALCRDGAGTVPRARFHSLRRGNPVRPGRRKEVQDERASVDRRTRRSYRCRSAPCRPQRQRRHISVTDVRYFLPQPAEHSRPGDPADRARWRAPRISDLRSEVGNILHEPLDVLAAGPRMARRSFRPRADGIRSNMARLGEHNPPTWTGVRLPRRSRSDFAARTAGAGSGLGDGRSQVIAGRFTHRRLTSRAALAYSDTTKAAAAIRLASVSLRERMAMPTTDRSVAMTNRGRQQDGTANNHV